MLRQVKSQSQILTFVTHQLDPLVLIRSITQGMISGGTGIFKSNFITDVLTDSSKMILKTDMFPLDRFKSQTLVIASQNEPMLIYNRIVRVSSDVGKSRIDHGRIGTPIVNKNIWSEDDNFRI